MGTIDITDEEYARLREYANSPLILEKLKAQAVMLAADSTPVDVIGRFVQHSPRTVERWLTGWRKLRMGSIFTGHAGNLNASYLTESQLAKVVQVLSAPPSETGIPVHFWSVPALADFCRVAFGVEYESDRSFHFLLRFAGLSFTYPTAFDHHRDPQRVTETMSQVKTEVAALLAQQDVEVFASDEVQISEQTEVRKAWIRHGEKTVIEVERGQAKQNFIGFLNQRTFHCELYPMDRQNSEEVLKALDRLLRAYPGKRIAIVWDNAKWHTSTMIREQLRKGCLPERVHLIAMPPYAPDHNPAEHVWKDSKEAIANTRHKSLAHTVAAFQNYVASRTFEYRI